MAPTIGEVCKISPSKEDRDDDLVKKECKIPAYRYNHKGGDVKKCGAPLVVVMVGLPARGKTVTANKLARYLGWTGHPAKVFVVSQYRRKLVERYNSHDMFRADNEEAMEIRRRSSQAALDDAVSWLQESAGSSVAILDGTNTTQNQRQALHNHIVSKLGYRLLFVELICGDEAILMRNIKEVLTNSPDYKDMAQEKAQDDFEQKVQHYLEQYEPLSSKRDSHFSYIKVVDEGVEITTHKLRGHLESKVHVFVANFSQAPKTLYFSRVSLATVSHCGWLVKRTCVLTYWWCLQHGESDNNVLGKIGGDANLSPRGVQYAVSLARHMNAQQIPDLRVWTSQLRRTKQTAQDICATKEHFDALNELDAGVCEGLTYEEMADQFPQEFAWRDQDKLRYRYPWGESYLDIMGRLEPVFLELEHMENVLVVSHQAVLRCVLGYFLGKKPEELPYINVPLHTIIKLTTEGYSCRLEFIKLPVECVDTYRQQPKNCSGTRSQKEALVTVPSHFDSLNLWQHPPLIQQH
ncbi:hypothetical protein PR048_023838 [Dryococelus australis]|uniref:6-phosphofructo-2-kinase domain-containing protein n=1 Tax=Dryococelus australis TaxID=614101 RepID=A0ABQ9GV66_9NEOP|nr:hypothetical protein PR048_023838 [Dryococelus australis]